MAEAILQNVTKKFGDFTAVDDISLTIRHGQFLTLLGPSGCGKTTTLRMIAGLTFPTQGRILIANEDVSTVPPERRNIGMVFQNYVLFPHLTVEENIGFGLRERRKSRADIRKRVAELLELVQLQGMEKRYPNALSGGQQQRAALARALAVSPRILLMDEPLGALDLKLRESMQVELRRIQSELKITTLSVTHDQNEALTMSDKIAVMNEGRIEQFGSPKQIYERPATAFIGNFVGRINKIAGKIRAITNNMIEVATAGGTSIHVAATHASPKLAKGCSAYVAVRPENIELMQARGEGKNLRVSVNQNQLFGRIEKIQYSGSFMLVHVQSSEDFRLTVQLNPQAGKFAPGDPVTVTWLIDHSLLWVEEQEI